MSASCLRIGVIVACACLAGGCKKGPGAGGNTNLVTLSGKVTLKGQPVTGGTLILLAKGGSQGQLQIRLNADGTYEAPNVPVGDLDAAVDTESLKTMLENIGNFGGGGSSMKPTGPTPNAFKADPKGASSDAKDMMAKMQTGTMPPGADLSKMKYVRIPEKYRDPKQSGVSLKVDASGGDKLEKNIDFP